MRGFAAVLGVLLVVSMVAPAVVVAADNGGSPENETETDGWTLEELRQDGNQPADSPPSVRLSDGEMLWLVHWPARSMWADVGDPMDDSWEFVGERGSVTDGSVYLRTIRTETGTEELTLRVVSYRVEEETRELENGGTVTEDVPGDVRERTVTAELEPGWAISKIDLPDLEEDREILIYAEHAPDELRWTFSHEPVATSQSATISTEGDYLWRVGTDVFLPALGMLLVGGGVFKKAIERAGKGPGWGVFTWSLVIGLLGVMALLFAPITDFADLLVASPTLLALVLVGVALLVFLESYEVRTKTVEFIQFDPYEVTSPSGEQKQDAIYGETSVEKVVELPQGGRAVVRDGPLRFLARALSGKMAKLPKADFMKTRIELDGDRNDELVFVDPDFESDEGEAIQYEPEGWDVRMPEYDGWMEMARLPIGLGVIAVVAFSIAAFSGFFALAWVLGALAVWFVRPTDGAVEFEAAKGHMRSAMASAMLMAKEIDDAKTLDQARDKIVGLQAKRQQEIEEELDKSDNTLVREAYNMDVDVSAKNAPDDGNPVSEKPDSEVTADDD